MMTCNKGFITLATGDYYCWLAEHLYMSYKLFGNCKYPFYVITDKEGEDRLRRIFDGVIVKEDFTRTAVDKMCLFMDTPFDETIFIDSDCSIVNDINYIFEKFEENGSDVSAIADMRPLKSSEVGIQFGQKAIDAFKLKFDFPNFNGGVYYYKKSEIGMACVDFMMNELYEQYHEYELLGQNNKTNMEDEPLVIVGMLKYGMNPIPVSSNMMVLVHDAKTVKWDINNKKCSFPWYGYTMSPTIIHWKMGGTETYIYEYYDAIVRGRFYHKSTVYILAKQILVYGKYNIYPKLLHVFPWVSKAVRIMKRRF